MILHVDMDAFYASIEAREQPELAEVPLIVGGSPDRRGVVCAANYEARRFGVHSAMPSAIARRLCPQAAFLPPRMELYAAVSEQLRSILQRFTPLVEPLSLDEAFLDVTGTERLFGPAKQIACLIKQAIRQELRLVASVGVAPNKFLAKIASDLEKPDGLVAVDAGDVRAFLDPLPVERLWGVGRQAASKLRRMRVRTVGQLRTLPAHLMEELFGNQGEHFRRLASGVDSRPVVPDQQAKSISHETTFVTDLAAPHVLRAWLLELTEQVARRVRRHDLCGRTVFIKVRFADFRTITRSRKLADPTANTDALWASACDLLDSALRSSTLPVRLLGVGVSSLSRAEARQAHLFDQPQRDAQARVHAIGDEVCDRFGVSALRRAGTFQRGAADPEGNNFEGQG